MANEEQVTVTEPQTIEVAVPTRDDLKSKGWTEKELDSAEKRGMVKRVEEKKDEKPPEPKAEEKAPIVEDKPKEAEKPKEPERKPVSSGLPKFDLTPEQEKVFLQSFGPGTDHRAMYFRMKNERRARQEAEAKFRELEAKVKALEEVKPAVQADEDPEDKPLTLKAIKELQKAEAERLAKEQAENQERASRVVSAQQEQEEYARSVYPDFDETMLKAKEVMQNLDSLIPDNYRQKRIVKLVRELQIAAANADKIGIDEDHAAMIAYEIGKYHPDYGKAKEEAKPKEQKPGGLTPEQMKRAEEHGQKRQSSASIVAGGGKRTISADDVTLADLNRMTAAERLSFREKHPARYSKLLKG